MKLKSHMIGRLGLSLLALGVIPMTPSHAPAAVDPRAVEHALDALSAAGISAPEVLEFAGGPERFAAMANLCIANKALLAEHGCPDIVDVARLLGRTEHEDPPELRRLSSGRLAKRAPPRPVVSTGFDGQAEILGMMLHPCGYCRCGGEGVCQWCVMNAKREADEAAAEERHKAVCELRRQNRGQQASARKVRQGKKSKRGF